MTDEPTRNPINARAHNSAADATVTPIEVEPTGVTEPDKKPSLDERKQLVYAHIQQLHRQGRDESVRKIATQFGVSESTVKKLREATNLRPRENPTQYIQKLMVTEPYLSERDCATRVREAGYLPAVIKDDSIRTVRRTVIDVLNLHRQYGVPTEPAVSPQPVKLPKFLKINAIDKAELGDKSCKWVRHGLEWRIYIDRAKHPSVIADPAAVAELLDLVHEVLLQQEPESGLIGGRWRWVPDDLD